MSKRGFIAVGKPQDYVRSCRACKANELDESELLSIEVGSPRSVLIHVCRRCAAKLSEKLDQYLTRTAFEKGGAK